jgi:hypothetical protein
MDEIRVPAAGGEHGAKKMTGSERMWRLVDKTRAECGCVVSRTADEDLECEMCDAHTEILGAAHHEFDGSERVNELYLAWVYNVWNKGTPFDWTEYRRK